MPVISSNALVRTFDSYSWVGMPSESTLISMPLNGLAASMNQFSSLSWASFDRVVGWNSFSAQRFAAASSARAVCAASATRQAKPILTNSPRVVMFTPGGAEVAPQRCPVPLILEKA